MTAAGSALLGIAFQPDWWQVMMSSFMRNAMVGGTLVATAAGVIGYFVIVRNAAFAAHALAHIGLPGATGAVLLGLPVTLGLTVFCVGGAVTIGALGHRAQDREVATGTVLSFATGLGLYFASQATRSSSTMTNVLFGNLLAVSPAQLVVFATFVLGVVALVAAIHRPLLFSSVDERVARSRGVPTRALSVVFMVLLGLVVAMSVQVVGTLLLFALVVTPAATAIMVTPNPARATVITLGLNLVSVWTGLVLAAMFSLPPSFCIVTIAAGTWVAVRLTGRSRHVML
ncbi:MAG: metal ABC transporter permease [Acidimicrobiales bacterium]